LITEAYTDVLWDREKGGCRLETVRLPTIVTKPEVDGIEYFLFV